MALTNSQYEQLMRVYEQRQLDNESRLRRHFEEVYAKIPGFRKLDNQISDLSLAQARKLLGGDDGALAELKKELMSLSKKKRELLTAAGYPEDYLDPSYTCPDCRDTGYIDNRKCRCFKKAVIDLLYTQSNLQKILDLENFETCSLEYYSSNHIDTLTGLSSLQAMQIALRTCHEFVDNFSDQFQNILLYGDTGVGKTFLSHCVAKELIERSFAVIYFTASQLFDIFAKKQFEKDADVKLDYDHIYDCDLLIIDDLGTEFTNSFTSSQLFICLNERILRRKSTLISTNLSPDDIRKLYSERVFSRISSSYTVLRLIGDDIRIQKKLLNINE